MPASVLLGILGISLGLSLWMRPWRLLQQTGLITPLLACLVLLPWFWALPHLHEMPLQLQLSGAVLATLCLGWPLAIPTLLLVGQIANLITPQPWHDSLVQSFYLGVLPATLALGLGAALRRWLPLHPFVYILGRGFFGSALCLFVSRLAMALLERPVLDVDLSLFLVAEWLMAWGDAFLTGLLTAILVAFRPQWLATWSDPLYLHKPH